MKDFRIWYQSLESWRQKTFTNAIDVVRFIKERNLSSYEIEYYISFFREYNHILTVEDGKRTSENEYIKIPSCFKKLGK